MAPALLAMLVLSACEDSSTGSEPSPVGTYVLLSIGGQELPARLAQIGQESLDLIGGSFLVRADGTCQQSFEVLRTYPDSEEIEVETYACTWERTGNTLVMTRLDGYRATAQILGTRLSLDGPDVATLTYER